MLGEEIGGEAHDGLELRSTEETSSFLEKFDELVVGSPIDIEKNLSALLPQARQLEDPSIYLQILSQVALAQAMQKRFEEAHQTLDLAENQLSVDGHLARARILCERGRVFWQAGQVATARPFFEQSFELSLRHQLDFHAINAAHLIAIIAEGFEEKVHWNQLALDQAEKTKEPRSKLWLGVLYNNLGQNYTDAEQYDLALKVYEKALAYREQEGYLPNIYFAQWAVARTRRLLNFSDEALAVLIPLRDVFDSMVERPEPEMATEVLSYMRGLVYEELAEIYEARGWEQAPSLFQVAYADISKSAWAELDPQRVERLRQKIGSNHE